MRRFVPLAFAIGMAGPVSAQLHPGDSVAVIETVRRFHAALEAGDTAALLGMLAPGAVVLKRGETAPLRGPTLEAEIRWTRAMARTIVGRTARVLGWGAYVYTTAKVEAKANPTLIQGTEVESIVLSRLGRTWFIELIHSSLGSAN